MDDYWLFLNKGNCGQLQTETFRLHDQVVAGTHCSFIISFSQVLNTGLLIRSSVSPTSGKTFVRLERLVSRVRATLQGDQSQLGKNAKLLL